MTSHCTSFFLLSCCFVGLLCCSHFLCVSCCDDLMKTQKSFSASFVLVQDSSHPFSPIPITTHPVKYVSSNESEIVSKKVYDLVLFTTEDGLTDKKMRKMTLFRDMSVLYFEHFSFRSLLFTTTPQLHDFFQNTSVIVVDDFK